MERVSTGISGLDGILRGGVPEGATVLVAGKPGTGKTIFAHQMAFYNSSPGRKVIYLTTLSEPLIKVMKYQQEFTFFNFSNFQHNFIYQDLGSLLRNKGPSGALNAIDDLLKRHEPFLAIIDSIKTVFDILNSSLECREFLVDLSVKLATWGCTTLLLGEYSEEELDVRPESAIVDGIIYLYAEDKKQQRRYLRVLKMRGTGYTGGENILFITERGIAIFPRVHPKVSAQSYECLTERISTGIAGLDEMTGGGIPRGTTTLVSSSSGTGKTILALHYAYAGLCQGENIIYVTFEENPNQILYTSANMGISLQPYMQNSQMQLQHISPIELNVDEHLYHIQKLCGKHGAKRVIIDSISSFEIGMEDKFKYTDYIWAMTDYFKTRGVSTLLTNEIHASEQASTITKHGISYLADNLLLLRFIESDMDIKCYLRVIKMRTSHHYTKMREFHIGSTGVAIGASL
ncbi:MAG: Circadian clock protein kinase KaiC [Pelotomaculum sp. PtaU1.Bin035]|nr:MAG: Circadian clock protein kinase KaiC [Pelotomaculum sp. PtaU1.Bin035]